MRILLTTILMLVCLVAYSATPSYSNFSSNQFAPSGTYTVTVKAKAEMTNTVFRGVGTPAAELHGGWLSTNDTTGSITVMSNASTVWSNGVAAGSVAITNAGGIMNLEGGPRGTVLQFRFNTSGAPAMVISNGMVGIGKSNPAYSLDAVGDINSGAYAGGALGLTIGHSLYLSKESATILVLADTSATTPSDRTIISQSVNTAGTNKVGGSLILAAGRGTGSNVSGTVYFDTASAGLTSNSVQNALSHRVAVTPDGYLDCSNLVFSSGNIIRQNISSYMTDAVVTNLLNVPLGKTNGMFVNTNGTLSYLWSDGWTVYGKTIAP